MTVTEMIEATPEYQTAAQQRAEQEARDAPNRLQRTTVGASIEPVLDLEKNDVEFWLQVAQLVVLIMILRRL